MAKKWKDIHHKSDSLRGKSISCEEAQTLAKMVFEGINKAPIREPYMKHIANCENCMTAHKKRADDMGEFGELLANMFD